MNQTFTKIRLFFLAVFIGIASQEAMAQCANNGVFYDDLTPIGVGLTNAAATGCAYGGEYYTVSVVAGNTYNFNTCGASYDTQLTLRNNATGALLDYDDDGSACGNGASDITWVSTFTGVARVQLNVYNCQTNQVCAPLEVTLVSEPGGGACDPGYIGLTQGACENGALSIDITFTGGGTCDFTTLYVSENGGPFDEYPITVVNGDALSFTGALSFGSYEMFAELSDGTFTDSAAITLTDCGSANSQPVYIVISPDCYGDEISWNLYDGMGLLVYSAPLGSIPFGATTQVAYTTVLYLEPGCYELEILDSFGDGLNPVGTTCNLVGYYGVVDQALNILVQGDPNYGDFAVNSFCIEGGATCEVLTAGESFLQCVGGLATYNMEVSFSDACALTTIWLNENNTGFVPIDLSFLALNPLGDNYNLTDLTPGASYSYYYELSDNSISPTYSFTTQTCVDNCGNAALSVTAGECLTVGTATYATATFTFDYTGTCGVSTIFYSTSGSPYQALDVSGTGLLPGSEELFYLIPAEEFSVYFELGNGTLSNVVTFTAEECGLGGTICDCAGNVLPAAALLWLGDGSFDDGTFFWNGETPVDFNCATWGFDCDDEGLGITLDLFGVCSGNLPPGNGCADVPCANEVVFDFGADCFPTETSVFITNAEGELIYSIAEGALTLEYGTLTQPLCLDAGCYTFTILDAAGDGLSYETCDFDGYFSITDASGILVEGPAAFGSSYTQEFCVGGEVCSNLQLNVSQGPCYDAGVDGLLPSLELEMIFDGACSVASISISENGVDYFEFPSEGVVTSGAIETFFNFTPNTTYSFFYTLDNGSVSQVVNFTTGDCNNEITICDCEGTSHTIGVLAWLGDDFADVGEYDWVGQPVNFNCATWGYDCGDIEGTPTLDVYGVCEGNLPPNNGCIEEVLGCTDETALNYNPDATINNGSCVYSSQFGCLDPEACNYNETAQFDNGSCEYLTCAGCTDPTASNYNPAATIDNGTCFYEEILGCTDPSALNYNPVATQDDGSCIEECVLPSIAFEEHCVNGDEENFYVTMTVSGLGNSAPYIVTNTFNQEQYLVNFLGTIEVGPFPNGEDVIITAVSSQTNACLIVSPLMSYACPDDIDGLTELNNGLIRVYPNPTNGMINLMNGGASDRMNVRVLNATGQVVVSAQYELSKGAVQTLDLSGLAAGTYMIEVLNSTGVEHHQVVVQK
ncbi:MAG: T9SS type A sorting domain-containing protein [Flavobacteriales bacterium]|jgi:hypothetical protein